jgi:hypothetical protein
MGALWTLGFFDIAHGGAYACAVNQRPFFMANPSDSPYFAGELRNLTSGASLFNIISDFFVGTSPALQIQEIMMDANCPHVFPKLLSDEAYSRFMIAFTTSTAGDLFKSGASSVSTLVESGTKGIKTLTEAGKNVAETVEGYTESEIKSLQTLLKLTATPAK